MPIQTAEDLIRSVETVDNDLSQGHVSVQEASQAVSHMNEGWEQFAKNCQDNLGIDLAALAVDYFGETTFDTFGSIKDGAITGLASVSSFFDAINTFGGSWRDPEQAIAKIQTGLGQISNGITQFADTLNNIAEAGGSIGDALSNFGVTTDPKTNVTSTAHPIINSFGSLITSGFSKISNLGGGIKAIQDRFKNGDLKVYRESFNAIMKGAKDGISGVSTFEDAFDSLKGSWRNPVQARQNIVKGLTGVANGTMQLGGLFTDLAKTGIVLCDELGIGEGKKDEITGNLVLTHPVLDGIGSFGNNLKSGGQGFIKSGIINTAGAVTESISRIVNGDVLGVATGGAAPIETIDDQSQMPKNTDDVGQPEDNKYFLLNEQEGVGENDNPNQLLNKGNVERGVGSNVGDFNSDMISEINVVLDGNSMSENSYCTINGEKYRLSNYTLSQKLLQPMMLDFSLEKDSPVETQSDVIFADSTEIIGKSLEINVSVVKVDQDDSSSTPQLAFVFKGMIIDVSASRISASTQMAKVLVATWDALLQNAPHCRSFENKTLKEIVDSVLKPYGDIKSKVSPRFKERIPYIVQYNQSDYAFISMLAERFGEWMYSTGEEFIFGEMQTSDSSVRIDYPGGSLMTYSLYQSMNTFSFNHLLPNHYQYGNSEAIIKESAQGLADEAVNGWTDKAYNASVQRYNRDQIVALSAGGFDNGKDNEGSDSILSYSLSIEAQGYKSGLMCVTGTSKLALLKMGQTFQIRDSVQNKSGESKDVEQKSLKVISVTHRFDYRQEYYNDFTAIPLSCNYPSYSNANKYAFAPSQRAKVVDNKDEKKLGRVRVQFPWQEIQGEEMKTPWLRIAVPYAGLNKGLQFVPEIGEEVMVGFEMNNAERPYIIGALFNGGNGKPDELWAVSKEDGGTTDNIKAIRTRNGHTILFNDKGDAGLLEIYDNKNNIYHITLSADDKKITIYSAGEIEVVADTDINVNAKGNIGINADGNIGIKSKGSISMEANKEVSIQASKVKVR